MTRLIIAISIAVASMAASLSLAPYAHATQPSRIAGQFGVQELYPKTIKRYKAAKRKLANLKKAYRTAQRAHDRDRMTRIEKSFQSTLASAKKALRKLKKVRGVATVVVWGDAGDTMPRDKITEFLRKTPSWQGRTVHIYARDGKLKYGAGAPTTYDDRKNGRSGSKDKGRRSHPGVAPLPPGSIVVPPLPNKRRDRGSSSKDGLGSGIFGLG